MPARWLISKPDGPDGKLELAIQLSAGDHDELMRGLVAIVGEIVLVDYMSTIVTDRVPA
jgi:hypothetical protein